MIVILDVSETIEVLVNGISGQETPDRVLKELLANYMDSEQFDQDLERLRLRSKNKTTSRLWAPEVLGVSM